MSCQTPGTAFYDCCLGRKGCRTGVGPFAVERDRRALLYLGGKEKYHQQICLAAKLAFSQKTVLAEVKLCCYHTVNSPGGAL